MESVKSIESKISTINTKKPNHRPPKPKIVEPGTLGGSTYYTIYEVAALMKLHHTTIRRMIKAGELPAKKYGRQWRIKEDDLQRFTNAEPLNVKLDE